MSARRFPTRTHLSLFAHRRPGAAADRAPGCEPASETAARPRIARRFWLRWGLAFLGFPLGGLAAQALVGGVARPLDAAIGGAAAGLTIGAAQWIALRPRVRLSPWWIAATGAAMATGLALGVALLGTSTAGTVLPWRGAITGLTIGLAQWPLLRRAASPVVAWVPTVTAGWALGWTVTRAAGVDLTPDFAVFGSTGAWAFQALTGVILSWLLGRWGGAIGTGPEAVRDE